MNEFYFTYPKKALPTPLARRAFVTTRDRAPCPATVRVIEGPANGLDSKHNQLAIATLGAQQRESGRIYVPCVAGKDSFFFVSTETLPSTKRQKSLFLELCRAQLSRIQRKRSEWAYAGLGLVTPENLRGAIREAVRTFAKLATADQDASFDAEVGDLFHKLLEISGILNERFLNQALANRRKRAHLWTTRFSFADATDAPWVRAFDSVFAPRKTLGRRKPKLEPFFQGFRPACSWREIEIAPDAHNWSQTLESIRNAEARGLTPTVGPLIRWNSDLPDRFYERAHTHEEISEAFQNYVLSAVDALGSKVHRWIVAANVEYDDPNFPFDFRLHLAAQAALLIKRENRRAQTLIAFEHPFGDYARFGAVPRIPPVELAHRLFKRRVFDGFYLETNFGLAPVATMPRDPMELHVFFDRWAAIGAPLSIGMSCPSASPFDPSNARELARRPINPEKPDPNFDEVRGRPLDGECWNDKVQQECARTFISNALVRRCVEEISWTKLVDGELFDYDRYSQSYDSVVDALEIDDAVEVEDEDEDDDEDEETNAVETSESDRLFYDAGSSASSSIASASVELIKEDPGKRDALEIAPTAGLFSADLAPKPTLHKLAALRNAYLE